jgi:hypothetical protein
MIFPAGRFLQVGFCIADYTCGEGSGDFYFSTFQKLKQALGVLLFVVCRIQEDC